MPGWIFQANEACLECKLDLCAKIWHRRESQTQKNERGAVGRVRSTSDSFVLLCSQAGPERHISISAFSCFPDSMPNDVAMSSAALIAWYLLVSPPSFQLVFRLLAYASCMLNSIVSSKEYGSSSLRLSSHNVHIHSSKFFLRQMSLLPLHRRNWSSTCSHILRVCSSASTP